MKKKIVIGVILIFFIFCTNIYANVSYSPTNNFFVNDFANILSSSTESAIQQMAVSTQNATTAQIVVVTVPDLEGRDIEGYSNELFNTWKIGNEEKDNGVLLLISSGDRKVRIEVGYGLEGAINDAKAGRILDDVAIPYMKNNDYDTVHSVYKYTYDIGGTVLAEPVYVNRVRFTSSIKKELEPAFDRLSKETRVPKSRLLDEAIEDLLKKYEKRGTFR